MSDFYEDKYSTEESYWGRRPSSIARILFRMYPPAEQQKLLDVGCGEGRDSIFFAQNGYEVAGFDMSSEGVRKSSARAHDLGLSIEFFKANILEYRLQESYDVVFSSGALHYIPTALREEILGNYKNFTTKGGLHAHTVPIYKPFLAKNPDLEMLDETWRSGEVLTYYHDWKIELFSEEILDDIHSEFKFPVNRIIAREPSA
jgi:tellurite methyltransferase